MKTTNKISPINRNLLIIIFLFISNISFSQETGCTSGNCDNGIGTFVWDSGNKYVGQWQNSTIHGIGTYYYTSGAIYQGEFTNGKMEGKGTYIWPNGTTRTGYWRNNQFAGQVSSTSTGTSVNSSTTPNTEIAESYEVVLYMKEGCSRSEHVARYLRNNNIPFSVVNITTDTEASEEMWQLIREAGYRSGTVTMPVVVVQNKVYYSIPDLDEFLSTLR
jgi:glutaredoxin